MKLRILLSKAVLCLLVTLSAGCRRPQEPAEEKSPAPVKWIEAREFFLQEWTEIVGTTQALPNHVARITAAVVGLLSIWLAARAGSLASWPDAERRSPVSTWRRTCWHSHNAMKSRNHWGSSMCKQTQSVLDTIPGIGPTRRKALLKRFGSVDGLRSATLDDMAATPGMNRQAAEAALAAAGDAYCKLESRPPQRRLRREPTEGPSRNLRLEGASAPGPVAGERPLWGNSPPPGGGWCSPPTQPPLAGRGPRDWAAPHSPRLRPARLPHQAPRPRQAAV